MNKRCELTSIRVDYKTRKTVIELTVDDLSPADAERYLAKALRLRLEDWKEKRSLNANAYYWELLGRLAKVAGQSNPEVHNLMLRRYGIPEVIDGQTVYLVLPDTDEARQKVDRAEEYHLAPTSEVREGKDGKAYRTYKMLRGSKGLNTAEFARLLDGLIGECEAVGIETITPDELARMMKAYGQHHAT